MIRLGTFKIGNNSDVYTDGGILRSDDGDVWLHTLIKDGASYYSSMLGEKN